MNSNKKILAAIITISALQYQPQVHAIFKRTAKISMFLGTNYMCYALGSGESWAVSLSNKAKDLGIKAALLIKNNINRIDDLLKKTQEELSGQENKETEKALTSDSNTEEKKQ